LLYLHNYFSDLNISASISEDMNISLNTLIMELDNQNKRKFEMELSNQNQIEINNLNGKVHNNNIFISILIYLKKDLHTFLN